MTRVGPTTDGGMARPVAVVLAAGASARMGRPKALLPVRGRPAVEVIVDTVRAGGCARVIVVTGRHAREIAETADLADCTVVEHAGWAAGRTSSIQAGLAKTAPGDGPVVLALVDMPLVCTATIRKLLGSWRAAADTCDVLVPTHGGRGGHPIVLSASLRERIAALGPDEPLRGLLRTVRRLDVVVADPGVLVDLDTPDDLRHLPPA